MAVSDVRNQRPPLGQPGSGWRYLPGTHTLVPENSPQLQNRYSPGGPTVSEIAQNLENYQANLGNPVNRFSGIANSAVGTSPAFLTTPPITPNNNYATTQPMGNIGNNYAFDPSNPTLPANPTFEDLARYEEARRKLLVGSNKLKLASAREALAKSLGTQASSIFDLGLPNINENLQAGGVYGSASERENARAQFLKEIALDVNRKLSDFDVSSTGLELQGDQDALDAALDIRRSQLESGLQQSQSDREQRLAEDLAKQQGRSSIYQSLIGAGGQLGGAYLLNKALNPKTIATNVAGGSVVPGSGAGTGFLSGVPTTGFGGMASLGAAGLGAMALSKAVQSRATKKLGSTLGTVAGTIANPIGKQLNKVKKIFCFDASTPITMADGSVMPIFELELGDKTKGGEVESLRVSRTDAGTRYEYNGIIVTGSHAVCEDGKWIRVKDSPLSVPIESGGDVFSIVTTDHRIFVDNEVFADEHETDAYEVLTLDQSLQELNRHFYVGVD